MRLNKVLASILLLSSLSFGQESEKDEMECIWAVGKMDYYISEALKHKDSNEYIIIWAYEIERTCDENTEEYKVTKKFLEKIKQK